MIMDVIYNFTHFCNQQHMRKYAKSYVFQIKLASKHIETDAKHQPSTESNPTLLDEKPNALKTELQINKNVP